MRTPVLPVHTRRVRFDPDPELTRLRETSSVSRIEMPGYGDMSVPAWLVTRSEDVREVLGDAGRFSNALHGLGRGSPNEGFLVAYDPPEHTRLRRLLTGEFTVKRMWRLGLWIEAIVAEHLDAMAGDRPPVDLVTAFALPIPRCCCATRTSSRCCGTSPTG